MLTPKSTLDYLHSLFSIPTLRWLCIKNVRWNKPLLVKDDSDRSRTSDVTKLSFPCSTLSANDLAEFITWPKALTAFALEIEPDARPRPNKRRFLDLLSYQKETLQELFLSGDPRIDPILDYSLNRELLQFTALKRLSVARNWFLHQSQTGQWIVHELWKALPDTLEQVQIEEPILVHYSDMRWNGDLDVQALSARQNTMIMLLHGIAGEMESRPLRPKHIALWLRKRSKQAETGPELFHHRDPIGDCEDSMVEHLYPQEAARIGIESRFKAMDCQLSFTCSSEPPLFEA